MRTDTGSTPPTPLQSLLRRWPLALVLGLLLAAAGYFGAGVIPSHTTAEARVAVGPGDMSAGAIAGFPESTREMAEDYARWVTSTEVQRSDGTQVTASPVPESNIIRVEATSSNGDAAVQAASQTAQKLISGVNEGRDETNPEKTLATMQDLATEWSQAKTELTEAESRFGRSRTPSESVSETLTKAQSQESVLRAQLEAQQDKYKQQISSASTSADLRLVSDAQVSSNTADSLRQRYALVGLAVGLLLALVIAVALDRRAARRRARD